MLNPDPTPTCGVLYVDDEEKALKYFRLAFSPKYQIFTASSAEEGLEVLRRESANIGIVLSDQRMPNMHGSQFLGMVRDRYPRIVRILTTAYTDLAEAIEAVNTGYIYQYVVKPWEIADLGMVLQRASDYFRVLTERNELLAVKMTTLQRIVCSDRLKWLLLWGRQLPVEEQPTFRRALVSFVKAIPLELNPLLGGNLTFSPRQFEVIGLLEDEYRNAAASLDALEGFRAGAEEASTVVESLVAALAGTLGLSSESVTTETGADGAIRIRMDATGKAADAGAFSRQLFGLFIERETPAVSLHVFQALLALARGGGSLEITLASTGGDFSVGFFPAGAADGPEDALHVLAEKFSAADISRL
ncbi:MAG TPA: response regulator [Chthoniobacterales bacterium]|jgi:two-component system probable response regulator PhcQ